MHKNTKTKKEYNCKAKPHEQIYHHLVPFISSLSQMVMNLFLFANQILGKRKAAEVLIRNGIDINQQDHKNQTALHSAALQGNLMISV